MNDLGRRGHGTLDVFLRSHREAAGLTQEALARRAGISLGALRDLEQGRTARPRGQSLLKLAAALRLEGAERQEFISADLSPGPKAGPGISPRLEVLGSLTAWRDGAPLALGPPAQRAVLGLLALHTGTRLQRDAIVDALWGEDPPTTSVAMIHAYISRIRLLLGDGQSADGGLVAWDGAGYRLGPGDLLLDLTEFNQLRQRARQAASSGAAASACELYDRALSLWRGPALEDIPALRGHPVVIGLNQQRSAAIIEYAIAAGGDDANPGDRPVQHLAALVAREPLHELAHAKLMEALAARGNQAAAVRVYEDLVARLDAELGIRPSQEVALAHERIVRKQPPPRATRPRQLPDPVSRFIGRTAEVVELTKLLDGHRGQACGPVVITGSAGVGKTALALHWAGRIAGHFPDGQLYADLRGFAPSGKPMAPDDVIRQFLEGLGIATRQIPGTTAAQAALYRSLLAGQRVLIVLDNAADAAQIRPLLPGSEGCLVLVTSRDRLIGLAAADGARLLELSVLTETEGCRLLESRLGQERAAADPRALAELVALAARLPLALAIIGTQAAVRPRLPLAVMAGELRDSSARLDALDTGDPATDVRTVFSWSVAQLSEPTVGLFLLLGLHPGPDLTNAAAASLAGIPAGRTRQALAELVRAHLIDEPAPGRFACHDLLRAYAAEQASYRIAEAGRRAAAHRMLDHYLHTASAAALLLHPNRSRLDLAEPEPGVLPEELAGREQALDWFRAEQRVVLALIDEAVAAGFVSHAWQLPWAVATFFNWQGHWQLLMATQETALAATRQQGDLSGQVSALHYLTQAKLRIGDYAAARLYLDEVLDLGERLTDDAVQARAHLDLGHVFELQGQPDHALHHAEQALLRYRAACYRPGEADALNAVGWCHAQRGEYGETLGYSGQALAIYRELGNRPAEASTLDSLGFAHHHLGRPDEAIACYTEALAVHGDAADRHLRAEILTHLGDARQATADLDGARRSWSEALATLSDLGHPDADQVRIRLRNL
jgi:DNA-binding SARP family transcriptional activator/tetratricopeptide (TPR) repeat protein/DNA-binding XRE family transcriptional regulator